MKILITAISPIIFYLLIGLVVPNSDHRYILLVTSLFYFVVGFKSKTKKQVSLFSIPFLTLIGLTLFLEDALTGIIIMYLILIPLSILMGYLTKNKSKLISLGFLLFLSFIFFYGFDNFNSFINNNSARTHKKSPKIELLAENNTLIKLDTIKNKIIVLDFWTTSCGVCFKTFPDFEKVYLEYEKNPNVLIYSVNIPKKRDSLLKTKKIVENLNYKFKTLYADSDFIPTQLGFNTYPHLTILKNGVTRYNGGLVLDEKIKIHNIRTEIDFLLNE